METKVFMLLGLAVASAVLKKARAALSAKAVAR